MTPALNNWPQLSVCQSYPSSVIMKTNTLHGSTDHLFSYNILELMTTESVPDCRLITKERILIEAHKIILFQSPHLRSLITSVSCDEGKCPIQETVTLILPDISYRHLDPIIRYFYTGDMLFPASEKPIIRDILLRLFKIPPDHKIAVRSNDRVQDGMRHVRQVQEICIPDVSQSDLLNKQNLGHQVQEKYKAPVTTTGNSEHISYDKDQEEEDIKQIPKVVANKLEHEERNLINHNYGPKVLKFTNFDEGFYQLKKVTVRVPLNIQTNMECLTCHVKVKRSIRRFKQHLVWKHLYPLWTEVGPNEIRCQDCDFVAVSRMKLIWHLAIEHGQFELKLKESNQTISDYGAAIAANTK